MKRTLILLLLLLAILVAASMLHCDGAVRAVSPRVAEVIRGSAGWYSAPQLVAADSDPYAVYVVAPSLPSGGRFEAVRIDADGTQRETTIALGPASPYKPFIPANARANVRGVRLERPAFHLMTFPDGKGPGFHAVDSATGEIVIMAGERPLLRRNAFNSSSAAELLSLVSQDPSGRWIAALSRTSGGWMLFLFPRHADSRNQIWRNHELVFETRAVARADARIGRHP